MSIPSVILTKAEDCPESLDRSLVNAYRTAEFRVFVGDQEWVLHHGERHPQLETWMKQRGLTGLAIITACNPGSVPLEEAENRRRNKELEQEIKALGLLFGPALNQSADGKWPEPGFWIANISQGQAITMGLLFGQAAVVWAGG